jgi:hypothetical protein
MKTKSKPAKVPSTTKKNGNQKNKGKDPRKPGTDPDQTPTRETQKGPVANPGNPK